MAAKFRKVDPRAWTDEKFRKLKSEEKLLALWMLTSVRVNRCGIVLWSPGLASEETGIPVSRIDTVCHTVCHTLNWIHDTVSHTVFLARWWRYNRPDNPKALAGALSDLHDLPENGLKSSLVVAANDLPIGMREMYLSHLDTVYHTVCHTVSSQEQEKEKEKEKEKDKKEHPTPQRGKNSVPPTLEEVRAYCLERRNSVDPEAFMDHNQTVGWRYGKGAGKPIRDWQAAIRTWEKNCNGHSNPSYPKPAHKITPSSDEVRRTIQEEFGHVKHPLFRDDEPEHPGTATPV